MHTMNTIANTVRLRVHIAHVGFEIDRIIVPAINMRADKVWLIGHANLSATQVYTHNTIEKLKNIHKQAHPKA